MLGAYLDEPEVHAHSIAPAAVLVANTGDGVNVNSTLPAEALARAVTMQSVVRPVDAINFVTAGFNILVHASVRFMPFDTIASEASNLGPVAASRTSVALDLVR